MATDFMTPPAAAEALSALSRMADVAAVPWGGYPQAERCRVLVAREEEAAALAADPGAAGAVAAVAVKGNFMFDAATHRDFLGGWGKQYGYTYIHTWELLPHGGSITGT